MGWLFSETVKKDANYHGCRYVWGKLHQKESDLVKLKKVFDSADRSGDGEVDIHEFLMYLDMERTKLIEHIFRQFDTDGGDSLSFKEFALALWTFASLDINGIGRFTYEIYKNDQRDGIDGTGITDFIEGVFGKGNVAGRERARNELERIRREEGGVIDRYEWEEFVEDNAKSSLGPLIRMHRVLCGKTLGLKFWEKARKGREEHYGELPWPAISKNIRAGDLREDDREISKHEHSFKDCVSAAFKHAEHKNSLLQKDYDRALEHCQKNLSRKAGDRGDEHPCYVDVQVAKEAIEKLEDLKRSEHRMDNRLSREEWTDCFMEVWKDKEMRRQLLLDPKPPKRKKQPLRLKKGQVQHVVKKDEWEPPPRAHCPPTRPQSASAMRRENKHQKLVWKMHRKDKRQKESRQSYADWAPSMNLPEAPEARQADRPKVEMGTFFDLGNEKATAAAKKAKKVEDEAKKAPKKKAKVTSFGPGGGTKIQKGRVSKARFSGNASVGSTQTRASRISVPSLKGAGGDLNLRWDMSVATGSFGGGRSVASRSSSSRRPKSASASLSSSRSRRSRIALAPA